MLRSVVFVGSYVGSFLQLLNSGQRLDGLAGGLQAYGREINIAVGVALQVPGGELRHSGAFLVFLFLSSCNLSSLLFCSRRTINLV